MEIIKNKLSKFALILVLWVGSVSTSFGFEGTWINQRSVIPQLKITLERNNILVSAWENNEGRLRSLGTVNAELVRSVLRVQEMLTATYRFSNGALNIRLIPEGEDMRVTIKDGYRETEYLFYKKDPFEGAKSVGSIYGEILGPAKSTASIFQILLYGPDNGNKLIMRKPLGRNKAFSFEGLPDGTYWMVVKARGVTRILPFPSEKKIIIRNGEAINQNVELK
ncbi:MAG: hypothetical protein AAFR87_15365 [Bacteroidota bacterium]